MSADLPTFLDIATVPKLNGHVLLPHQADWSVVPKLNRIWRGSVESSIGGAEDRLTARSVSWMKLSYQVLPFSHVERAIFDANMREALRTGKIAVPFFSRGVALDLPVETNATELTISRVDMDVPRGTFVFIQSCVPALFADWDFALVVHVSGRGTGKVLTIASGLDHAYPAGTRLWPILFGRPIKEQYAVLNASRAQETVSLQFDARQINATAFDDFKHYPFGAVTLTGEGESDLNGGYGWDGPWYFGEMTGGGGDEDVEDMTIEYSECLDEFTLTFPMLSGTMCILERSSSAFGPWDNHIFCSMTPDQFTASGGIKSVRMNNDYDGGSWFRARYAEYVITSAIKPLPSEVPAPVVKLSGVLPSIVPNTEVPGRYGKLAYSSEEDPYISATDLYIWPRDRKEYRLSLYHFSDEAGAPYDYTQASVFQEIVINPTGSFVSGLSITNPGLTYVAGQILRVNGGSFSVPAEIKVTAVDGSGHITSVSIVEPGVYGTPPSNPVTVTSEDDALTGASATFNLTFTAYDLEPGLTHKWTRDRNDPTVDTVVRKLNGYDNNAFVSGDDFGYIIKARSFSETCKSPQTCILVDKRINEMPPLRVAGIAADITGGCTFPHPVSGWESGDACLIYDENPPADDTDGFVFFQRKHIRKHALDNPQDVSGFSFGAPTQAKLVFHCELQITDVHLIWIGYPAHYASCNYFASTNAFWERFASWNRFPAGYTFSVLYVDSNAFLTPFGDGINFGDSSDDKVLGPSGTAVGVSAIIQTRIAGIVSEPLADLSDINSDSAWSHEDMVAYGFEICPSAFDDREPAAWKSVKPYYPGGATSVPNFTPVDPVVPVIDLPDPLTQDIADYAGDDFESYADQDATGATLAGGNHFGGDWVIELIEPEYGIDDFETYAVAAIDSSDTTFTSGEQFGGPWVFSEPHPIFNDDFESYTVAVIARFDSLNGGTGYSGAWAFEEAPMGRDDFESYAVGAIPTMEGGIGWALQGWRVV